MNLLAFDTSTSALSVAILAENHIIERNSIVPRQHAKLILPVINELLTSCSFTLDDIDAIAYGCGPGSYTGIRIASSVAQGLAYAKQKPVIPISSLAAAAQTAYQNTAHSLFLVAVDAHMRQLYWGAYQVNSKQVVELIGTEKVITYDDVLFSENTYFDACGVGDGWLTFSKPFQAKQGWLPKLDETSLPTAHSIIQLACRRFINQDWLKAHEALPAYLREMP